MNTLACLAALVALGWLAHHFFVVDSEPVLGFAVVIVMALVLAMTWLAAEIDAQIIGGRRK